MWWLWWFRWMSIPGLIWFESVLAHIFRKSYSCMYAYIMTLHWLRYSGNPPCICKHIYILKIYWLRYSGNPAAVCKHTFWHSTGSDTREMSPSLYARICFERILAQIFGKSCCCMQEYALKVYGLRYSGNPAPVCMNIFWHSTGSDTREILPVYARMHVQISLAQILGISCCCIN